MGALIAALLILVILGLPMAVHVLALRGDIADWVKPERSLTMIGVLAGFIILAWQLNRQHRNSLAMSRNALWLEIYREIADASKAASNALQDSLASRAIPPLTLGLSTALTFQEISDSRFRATHAVIALMAMMEKWEIALGGDFQRFKQALSETLNAWGECVDRITHDLMPYLIGTGGTGRITPPAEDIVEKLKVLERDQVQRKIDVLAVIWDLRVASQNRLLGGLFTYRVPVRKPLDPGMRVTTIAEKHKP